MAMSGTATETVMEKKRQRKKKRGKLPKGIETPGGDVDPERWLPRKERSYYRGKRKDKRKEIGKGTQGIGSAATQALADSLDASKTMGGGSEPASPRPGSGTPASPSASSAAPAQGPRLQKPAAAKK